MSEKKQNNISPHFPAMEWEDIIWDILLIDIIEHFKIKREVLYELLILKNITILNPVIGWSEIVQYNHE